MVERFYIDRQFGQAIWIDVEKGIVKDCYNEERKYNDRMNELYVGKSITFLKEDFVDRAMKGTYHHLRAERITSCKQRVASCESSLRFNDFKIQENLRRKPRTEDKEKEQKDDMKLLEKIRNDHRVELYEAEQKLKTESDRILKEHNYEV